MTLAPGSRLGPYEISAQIGEGGMGEVYRATDSRLKREVAIKVLPAAFVADKERLARFEREAQLLAQLNHPNIAHIYGMEATGESHALVMELVEGPTLAERLAQGALPIDESLAIAKQIAEALEEAHEKGIVHRDLKPQNIKTPIEGKTKVLDFGLAKAMDPASGSASDAAGDLARSPTLMNSPTLTAAHGTQLGVILGTAAYMSPEQARGGLVDKRADIWAFGVVLHEMLTGHSLFAGPTVSDTLAGVLKTEIDWKALPAGAPPAIRGLLRRCLERNPRNRLRDIGDARLVLEEVLDGGGEAAPASSATGTRRGDSRRELAAWALALGATVAALVLVVSRSSRSNDGASPPAAQIRFSITPEAQGSLRGFPALSSDGTTLIYSLEQEDGASALWAHSLETGSSRRLPGTEGGTQPFWSPDGKQLGFFAGGQLKRLDLGSGLTQALARAADPRGGSWSRDGGILISVNSTAPIVRVVPGSGASQSATELAQNRGEQSHRFPWALSTGGFLFTSTGSPEIQGIYWQGRDAAAPQRIVPDLSRAACDERGFLFWVRDGVLVAQRFDPENGELSGEPIAIAELTGGDAQVPAEFWFSVSASGTIALRPGSGLGTELVWLDRSGAALGAASPPGAYREPALSPDGRWVAVDVSPVGKRDEVYIVDASALDQSRRLTFDAAGAETPIWSPDGRWVAYSSPRTNGWDLLRKAADGSGGEELLFAAGTASWVDSWSPDGSTLLFERYVPEQGSDLWLLPLEGERRATPLLVTPANESHASFSPDGRLVAYVSDESGVAEVYVRTLAASGGRWQVSRGGGDWPAWSADGKELFYAGLDRLLQSAPIKSLEPYSFGSPEPLFRLRTYEPKITSNRNNFVPAPDGRRFLVSQRVGEERDTRVDVLVNWRPTGASP